MTWNTDTAKALAGAFDGVFDAPGVVTAAACIDETGTAVRVNVHARATDTFQEHISVEQIERAWRASTRILGPVADVLVTCRRSAALVVDAKVTFANGAAVVRITFNSSAQIAGLKITRPAKP